MDMAAWIFLCLFASVGVVQCGAWLVDAFKKPALLRRCYRVIPLYDEPDRIEAQLRYALASAHVDGDIVVLLDMGLGDECTEICDRLTWGIGGVCVCTGSELAAAIEQLDNLQVGKNIVE